MKLHEQDAYVPGGMAAAMEKLEWAIATREVNGKRLQKFHVEFMREILGDLETSAAMYED